MIKIIIDDGDNKDYDDNNNKNRMRIIMCLNLC